MQICFVPGPVDQHGYCQAQVNGRVGLVPARYLLPLSQLSNENGRQKLLERRRKQLTQCPSHLSNVPEKVIQMNLDIYDTMRSSKQGDYYNFNNFNCIF